MKVLKLLLLIPVITLWGLKPASELVTETSEGEGTKERKLTTSRKQASRYEIEISSLSFYESEEFH
jgi:hypothetical protein